MKKRMLSLLLALVMLLGLLPTVALAGNDEVPVAVSADGITYSVSATPITGYDLNPQGTTPDVINCPVFKVSIPLGVQNVCFTLMDAAKDMNIADFTDFGYNKFIDMTSGSGSISFDTLIDTPWKIDVDFTPDHSVAGKTTFLLEEGKSISEVLTEGNTFSYAEFRKNEVGAFGLVIEWVPYVLKEQDGTRFYIEVSDPQSEITVTLNDETVKKYGTIVKDGLYYLAAVGDKKCEYLDMPEGSWQVAEDGKSLTFSVTDIQMVNYDLATIGGAPVGTSKYQDYVGYKDLWCVSGDFTNSRELLDIFIYCKDSGVEADKTALNDEIAKVTGDNAANWYQENDLYNGKDTSKTGFWAEMQVQLAKAQKIANGTDANQSRVNQATSDLHAAIAKLISKQYVNATENYERLNRVKKTDKGYDHVPTGPNSNSNFEKADFVEKDWTKFEAALTTALDQLKALYNEDGTPSARNWGESHEGTKPANAITNKDLATALENLYDAEDSMRRLSALENAKQARQLAARVDAAFPATKQGQYSDESWAAFTAARDKAHALLSQYPTENNIPNDTVSGQIYNAARSYYAAAYGLTEPGEITVHLTIGDNYGALYPAYAIKDAATATFDADVKLPAGQHSFKALTNLDVLNWTADHQANVEVLDMFFVNGQLVADMEGKVVYGTAWLNSEKMQVRNGDRVVILHVLAPEDSYYIWPIYATLNTYRSYVQLLRFTTDGSQLNAAEGKAFTVNVETTPATFEDYTNVWRAASGKQIIAYGPRNADGTYPSTPLRTGAFTDASGNASVTLYAAGHYVLTAVDTSEMVRGSKFPNLPGGARMEIDVASQAQSEMEKLRQQMLTDLETLYNRCDQGAMDIDITYWDDDGNGNWKEFKLNLWTNATEAYHAGKTAIAEAEALLAMKDAYAQAETAIEDAIARAEQKNNSAVQLYRFCATQLPTTEQLKAGDVLSADMERFGGSGTFSGDSNVNGRNLKQIYADLTDYQKTLLTPAENEQYQTLDGLYQKYAAGSFHPEERTTFTVTYKFEGLSPEQMTSNGSPNMLTVAARKVMPTSDATVTITPGSPKNNPLTYQIGLNMTQGSSGVFISTRQNTNIDELDYEVYDIQIEGTEDYEIHWNTTFGVSFRRHWIEFKNTYGYRNNITVTIYTRSKTADLEGVRNAALNALNAAYAAYDKDSYSSENWTALTNDYQTGLSAIKSAASIEAVNQAKDAALAAMAARPTVATTGLGKVTVTMENNTRADLPFYGEAGILDSVQVDLTEDSSVMTVMLSALKDAGYEWTGTGGSKGGNEDDTITYLASISKNEQTLGEFTGSSGSGWMITLNDWFINEGAQAFSVNASNADYRLSDGDVIRWMYTDDLGKDLNGTWANANTTLASLTASGATLAPDFAGTTNSYTLTPEEGQTISLNPVAANKNYQVRIYLNGKTGTNWYRAGEAIPAKAGDTIYIGCGDRSWPSMNKQGTEAIDYVGTWYTLRIPGDDSTDYSDLVKETEALIASITNYTSYNEVFGEEIDAARKSYDALPEEAKPSVSNYSKLTAAEEKYARLKQIKDAKEMLDALPVVKNLKTSDKAQLEAAAKAYEDLSEADRKQIPTNLTEKLKQLQSRMSELEVEEVIKAIDALAPVTKDSGAAIKAARDAYNELTDAQKKLVTNYDKLTAAEARWSELNPIPAGQPAQLPQNPSAGETLPFTDVNANSWYYSGVKFAYEKGLMNGTGNGTFSPNADTTRGMIVTMLARLEGVSTSGTPWYAASQKWAMDAGISDGTNMTGAITREQLAAILFRYAKQKGYDISKSADLNGFADANTVSAYATDAMRWAVASGLIQGSDSKLNPKGSATRAQVATILMRFMELYAK